MWRRHRADPIWVLPLSCPRLCFLLGFLLPMLLLCIELHCFVFCCCLFACHLFVRWALLWARFGVVSGRGEPLEVWLVLPCSGSKQAVIRERDSRARFASSHEKASASRSISWTLVNTSGWLFSCNRFLFSFGFLSTRVTPDTLPKHGAVGSSSSGFVDGLLCFCQSLHLSAPFFDQRT